jgi:hypothetical protein
MSVTPPTHTYTCPTLTTVKSLGPGLDSVVTSATIYLTTASEVAYTEAVTDTQWPVQTGTTEETYEQTQYTSPLVPSREDIVETTDGTEVFREAIPRTKIGDVVSLTREVPVYDIPEPIVTTSEIESTRAFESFASFVVEFDTSGLDPESFVAYPSLTEDVVVGWARAAAPETFAEAEEKNSARVALEADMFLNPDRYSIDAPVPPWKVTAPQL